MNVQANVDRLMASTRRYWYEDGFTDLGMGLLLFAMALLFGLETITPTGSPLWFVWSFGWPLLLIGGGVLINHFVQRMKARYTYPRTGFVSYERQGRPRLVQLLAAFIVAALIGAVAVALSRGWFSIALWFGLAFTAAFTYLGVRVRLARYLVLALWSLLVGLGTTAASMTIEPTSAWFFGLIGIAMIISGLYTWRRFSRAGAPGEESADGRQA